MPSRNRLNFAIALTFLALVSANFAFAQYKVTNLVADQAGKALHQDSNLVNAWGIAYAPTGAIFVADAGTGLATSYNAKGVKQPTVITIPSTSKRHGTPTGIVFNATTDFQISQGSNAAPATFLFDTIDGTISGWNATVNANTAIVVVNNSKSGASYTGIAIGANNGANFLYAANHTKNQIEIYDGSFNLVGTFTDTSLPSGSGPFNIQNLNGLLYVAFTVPKSGGAVDVFDTAGNLVQHVTSGSPLKAPWGLALAPSNFGSASNDLLVGNLNDGKINAYDPSTGSLIGPLTNSKGKVIVERGLWAVFFGGGSPKNGKTNQLFFASGPGNEKHGLFGVIAP